MGNLPRFFDGRLHCVDGRRLHRICGLVVAEVSVKTRKQLISEIEGRMTREYWSVWGGVVRGMKHRQLEFVFALIQKNDVGLASPPDETKQN